MKNQSWNWMREKGGTWECLGEEMIYYNLTKRN